MEILSKASLDRVLRGQLLVVEFRIKLKENIYPFHHWPERISHDDAILKKHFEYALGSPNTRLPMHVYSDFTHLRIRYFLKKTLGKCGHLSDLKALAAKIFYNKQMRYRR